MAAMKEIICACGCGRKKNVRLSDLKRGWGKFYSKSCKAKVQERKTGQYKTYKERTIKTVDGVEVDDSYVGLTDKDWDEIKSESEIGWQGHKGTF